MILSWFVQILISTVVTTWTRFDTSDAEIRFQSFSWETKQPIFTTGTYLWTLCFWNLSHLIFNHWRVVIVYTNSNRMTLETSKVVQKLHYNVNTHNNNNNISKNTKVLLKRWAPSNQILMKCVRELVRQKFYCQE